MPFEQARMLIDQIDGGHARGNAMSSVTFDQVRRLVDMLSSAEKARLVSHLTAQLEQAAGVPLGERLRTLRAEIIASGAPLLDRDTLADEIAERRGE
jgi:hypothetical protein